MSGEKGVGELVLLDGTISMYGTFPRTRPSPDGFTDIHTVEAKEEEQKEEGRRWTDLEAYAKHMLHVSCSRA